MNINNGNSSEIYEDAESQIIFKYKPDRMSNNFLTENYKITEEPKYCVIRTNFNVEDCDYTDFEKRKLDYFIQTSRLSKAIEKKLKDEDVNTFINHKLLSSKEECYRFCNMFSYDVDMAINHLINYIELIRNLKEEYNFFELCDSISNREVGFDEGLYIIGKDYKNRPIIGIDFTNFDKSNTFSHNVIEQIIIKIISFMNNIFDCTKYSINNDNQQIKCIVNLGKLSQNDLPEDYSAIIKFLQYLYPSRLHQIFIKNDAVELLSYLEDNFFYYNLEKIKIIDLNNFQMRKDLNIEFDPNILVDFLNNPIKFKLEENGNLQSLTESNQLISAGSYLKFNEVEPKNWIVDREIQEDYNRPFNLERNDFEKTNFTGKDILNSIDTSEYNIVMKPSKCVNEFQIENFGKLNILNASDSTLIRSDCMNKEFTIEKRNNFSIMSERNIIEVKPIIKRKIKNKFTYESKEVTESCNLNQCNII